MTTVDCRTSITGYNLNSDHLPSLSKELFVEIGEEALGTKIQHLLLWPTVILTDVTVKAVVGCCGSSHRFCRCYMEAKLKQEEMWWMFTTHSSESKKCYNMPFLYILCTQDIEFHSELSRELVTDWSKVNKPVWCFVSSLYINCVQHLQVCWFNSGFRRFMIGLNVLIIESN